MLTLDITEKELPKRTKLRSENDEPRWIKSMTDRVDPSRVMPKTDKELPSLMKLLRESVEPRCKKSSTDRDEPSLVIP